MATAVQRFWAKVSVTPGCWLWTGCIVGGYGQINIGQHHRRRAHRFAYELFVGPVPKGLVLDHLCRTPACVNPAHLEAVTNRENILRGDTLPAANLRKTHCLRGHAYSGANLRIRPNGKRVCLACRGYYR